MQAPEILQAAQDALENDEVNSNSDDAEPKYICTQTRAPPQRARESSDDNWQPSEGAAENAGNNDELEELL